LPSNARSSTRSAVPLHAPHENGTQRRTKSVLVLEDAYDAREDLAFLIESRGYTVVTAADGSEAITKLRTMPEPPGLILLDLLMPAMDGWTFGTALRAEPLFRNIPIVVLSGVPDFKAQADALGALDALEKPVDLKRLWSILARVCGPLRGENG
jgi:twitching motility two-component system response regulator PilH